MDDANMKIRITGRLLRIARLDAELFHFLSNPQATIDRLRNSRQRIDIFTFMQGPSDATPRFDYPMEWDNLAVLPVSTFENWQATQIGGKTRKQVRNAERKGIAVRETAFDEDLVRGVWEIYNESPIRQGRRFPHYGKDLKTVYQDEATYLKDSVFIGAYRDEELVGFIKMITAVTGTVASMMNILSKIQHRDKAPTNALIAEAVRLCAARRIGYLIYGNFDYGRKQHDGLREFKRRNGFIRVDIPRYYVPLTRFGRVALRIGLHHRLIDCIPEPVAAKLREIRKQVYDRIILSPKEAN
jgi:hypothetical protein